MTSFTPLQSHLRQQISFLALSSLKSGENWTLKVQWFCFLASSRIQSYSLVQKNPECPFFIITESQDHRMAGLEGTSEIIWLQPPRHNQSFQPLHQASINLKIMKITSSALQVGHSEAVSQIPGIHRSLSGEIHSLPQILKFKSAQITVPVSGNNFPMFLPRCSLSWKR